MGPIATRRSVAGLAAEAIRAGLVDRNVLRLVPTIVGGGTPALPDSTHVDLALNTNRPFDDGSGLLDHSVRGQQSGVASLDHVGAEGGRRDSTSLTTPAASMRFSSIGGNATSAYLGFLTESSR